MDSIDQLKLLINLARVDGEIVGMERNYILSIGQAHKIATPEINALFENPASSIVPQKLSPNQRFDYVLSLVRLMNIDEKLYRSEIHFCADAASKLGYKKEVILELIANVKGMGDEELLKATKRYLQSANS